jgi:hypothetical protein
MLAGVDIKQLDATVPEALDERSELYPLRSGTADENNHGVAARQGEITPEEQDDIDRAMFHTYYTPKNVREQASLQQWQRLFAAWYAHVPIKPTIRDCVNYARAITKFRIGDTTIKELMRRPDFQRLVVMFRESEQKRAKELLNADYQTYLEAHRAGLDMALAAGDYRAVPPFTTPMLERISPKKEEAETRPTQIIINLPAAQGVELARITGTVDSARDTDSGDPDDIEDAQILEIEDDTTP